MTTPANIDIGSTLGSYRLTDELGVGGAGKIFRASHVETGEEVAIKVLRPGAELDEDIHGRFIREISVAQKLNDPHIVAYRDCGIEDGVLFFTMEFVPWGSLADVLRARSILPWREACECGEQICKGLSHLHASNIVHRDLKPANIFLSDDGRLKLGDFGLARDFDSHRLTTDGITVGTGRYIAPEQALGESNIDGRTDLYALGCNLFEFLVGHTPHDNHDVHDPVSFGELMRRHVEDPVPKVSDLVPSCPAALSQLIGKLLSKDRDERPRSAVDVAAALQRIQQDPEAPLDMTSLPTERERERERERETSEPTADQQSSDEAHLTERLTLGNRAGASEVSARSLVTVGIIVVVIIAVAAVFGSSGS